MSKRINELEPRDRQYFVSDGEVENLLIRVMPSGYKSYVFRFQVPGSKKKREVAVGDASKITILQARKKARELQAGVILGSGLGDPSFEGKSTTVKAASEAWLKSLKIAKRAPKYIENEERLFRLHILPEIGHKTVADVGRADIVKLMDKQLKDGNESQSRKVITAMSMLLNFSIQREWIEHNIAASVKPTSKVAVRERVLSVEQLRTLKEALRGGKVSADTKDVITLLMHTGQRRGEVLGMTWGEVDLEKELWLLPGSRTKNRTSHSVPLSKTCMEILAARLPENFKTSDPVFSTATYTVGQACRRIAEQKKFPIFGPHDLRRTMISTLPELDQTVTEDLMRRIINHNSGRGALAHYAHYAYEAEKRRVLVAWSEWLDKL